MATMKLDLIDEEFIALIQILCIHAKDLEECSKSKDCKHDCKRRWEMAVELSQKVYDAHVDAL